MSEHSETEIETHCPYCGALNQVAAGAEGTTPSDGDVSLCWECNKFGIFRSTSHGFIVLKPTKAQEDAFYRNPDMLRALDAVRKARTPNRAARRMTRRR